MAAAPGLLLTSPACLAADGLAWPQPPWFLLSLALILMALMGVACALAAGLWVQQRAARALRTQARLHAQWTEVLPAWSWRSDERHHLTHWQPPAAATAGAQAPKAAPALFQRPDWSDPHPALRAALREGRVFRDLRLEVAGQSWRLDGAPLHDDAGALIGHVGCAQRLPRGASGLALDWLEALPGPALLARGRAPATRLVGLNRAARSLWPEAESGTPLRDWPGLPPAWASLTPQLEPAVAQSLDDWQFLALAADDDDDAGPWLLVQRLAQPAGEPDLISTTLSHDLRAPIRVVEGFTRIVKEDYGRALGRVGSEHLDRVLSATGRMNLMIDALLAFSRLSAQPLLRKPVDLSALAEQVVDELRRTAPERTVQVEIEPGLRVQGDPMLLRMVLENLLGNAWKYTAHAQPARVWLRSVAHAGQRAFEVADNGAGFDMRAAERLFGLFQRLHSASDFPGHGVGLASVRRIVRRHGGEVWAQGEPGRGARFAFTLA